MKKIPLLIIWLCIWHLAGAQFVITITDPNCMGECTGKAQITPPAGTGGYYYKWSNGDTSYHTGNLCPGTYFCSVSNSLQEPIDTFTIVISQPLADDLIVTISNVSCEGGDDGVIRVTPTVLSLEPYIYGCNVDSFRFQYSSQFYGLDTGWYEILAIDYHGCDTMIFAHVGETDTPCTTLINELNTLLNYTVWPNPASNQLNGRLNMAVPHSTLQISSADGRIVIQPIPVLQNHFEIDISSLASGMYFIQLQDGQQSWVRRFVKE